MLTPSSATATQGNQSILGTTCSSLYQQSRDLLQVSLLYRIPPNNPPKRKPHNLPRLKIQP